MNTPANGPSGPQPNVLSTQVNPQPQYLAQPAKAGQNLALGIVGGIVAAIVAAVLWAGITILLDRQIGWMAIGVGFFVGFAVREFGQGRDQIFGITGATLSLLGCVVGNLLAIAIIVSQQEAVSIVKVLLVFVTAPETIFEVLQATFSPIDLLFYGLAIYEGYRFSFRTSR